MEQVYVLSACIANECLPLLHECRLCDGWTPKALGSTDLFRLDGIGHEKCAVQGANRSDTAWYREDLQRRRAHFVVAETPP
ncbi:hypothetical protein G4G28_00665 [Massilia sp. Dwa41.01b]|nr:hypothetical protein G4G28_00665 [Massilia sp. Dwa41.01b]QNA98253.1 hypothetical protein G4G31_04425 [Massilia sp. Se16.2.3]